MTQRINPFQELYLGESISSDRFVHLFSPFLVHSALTLFHPGHVVLKGLPGSGKSMLLSLLKPEVLLAYQRAGKPFPVPPELCHFVGAGINLSRSGISDISQRPISKDGTFGTSPYYFADFLNYYLVFDVIRSVQLIADGDGTIAEQCGVKSSPAALGHFTELLARHECWMDALRTCRTYEDLKAQLQLRIRSYRNFLNYNLSEIPSEIHSTKTLIGEPINACVQALREAGIISSRTNVFVRLDQYENLKLLESEIEAAPTIFQQVVHKLLGARDTTVSYRIGTRRFGWPKQPKIFGSSATLEKERNYIVVSMEEMLKRRENRRTWVFPRFAADILDRRLRYDDGAYSRKKAWTIVDVFGRSPRPNQRVEKYVADGGATRILSREVSDKPKSWNTFLAELAKHRPLSARLAEAWVDQQSGAKKAVAYREHITEPYPWEEKLWWRKERIEQALLQIASRNNQNLVWYGESDVINLSGGNILAFITICRHVWDVAIREHLLRTDDAELSLPFNNEIQNIGIQDASASWLESVKEEPDGLTRQVFVRYLGTKFYNLLVSDSTMGTSNNPGFAARLLS